MNIHMLRKLLLISCCLLAGGEPAAGTDMEGSWVINYELSDDTDRQVEKAIREAGGRPTGGKGRGREKYRGGPADQQLYDHISYDPSLHFSREGEKIRLRYNDGFERTFYSDGRGRVASASGTERGDSRDYSFATWDGEKLLVESRPLDGGRIYETFTLEEQGARLRVELELQPLAFRYPIILVRIYERPPELPEGQ